MLLSNQTHVSPSSIVNNARRHHTATASNHHRQHQGIRTFDQRIRPLTSTEVCRCTASDAERVDGDVYDDNSSTKARPTKDKPDKSFRGTFAKGSKKTVSSEPGVVVPEPIPAVRPGHSENDDVPPLNFTPSPDEPDVLPRLVSQNPQSSSKPAAALQQMLRDMQSDESRQDVLDVMEEQYDQQLLQQFRALPKDQQDLLLSAADRPEQQWSTWERELLEPVMQDKLREDLGPELSEIMDIMLGPDPYEGQPRPRYPKPITRPKSRLKKAGSEPEYDINTRWEAQQGETERDMRRRLQRLTPEQRDKLPQLLDALESVGGVNFFVGYNLEETKKRKQAQADRRYRRLARRAREKGLAMPDPPRDPDDPFADLEEIDSMNNAELDNQQKDIVSELNAAGVGQERFNLNDDSDVDTSEVQTRTSIQGLPDTLGDVYGLASTTSENKDESTSTSPADTQAGPTSQRPQARQTRFDRIRQILIEKGMLPPDPYSSFTTASGAQTTTDATAESSSSQDATTQTGSSSSSTGPSDGEASGPSDFASSQADAPADTSGGSSSINSPIPGGAAALYQTAIDKGLDTEVAELVEKLGRVYERYNLSSGTGWAEEGHLGSPEMQCLKRAALSLSQAAQVTDDAALQDLGVSQEELQLSVDTAMNDITALLELQDKAGPAGLDDTAVQSALVYLRTQLLKPVDDLREVEGGEELQEAAGNVLYLPVDEDTTDRLLKIIPACEAWEALHSLAGSWGLSRPGILLARALTEMSRAGGGNALWWAKNDEELSYAEQAAVLRRRLELRAARTGQGQMLRPGTLDELVLPKEDLIEAMCSLDSGVLRCLQELEQEGYSDEVLMKWSLHPVVGPRLTAGVPLIDPQDIHPYFQDVFIEAQNVAAEGLDFQWRVKPRSDPIAQDMLRQQAKAKARAARQSEKNKEGDAAASGKKAGGRRAGTGARRKSGKVEE